MFFLSDRLEFYFLEVGTLISSLSFFINKKYDKIYKKGIIKTIPT